LPVRSAALPAKPAHAQTRPSMQAAGTDPQEDVLPAATVTLTDKETTRTLTTTTNDAGIYNFNALRPSQYRMSVEKEGFKKKVLDNVGIIAEQANGMNVQLELGQSSETVTVRSDS